MSFRFLNSVKSPFFAFCAVFLITRIFLFVYLLQAGVGLLPDEAQYWTWSRSFNFGYYSKPPGIAWQIAVSSLIFPHGICDIAVRFISFTIIPCISALYVIKATDLLIRNRSISYLAGILYLLSPLGLTASIFATTDGVMVLCSFIALFYTLCLSERTHQKPVYRDAVLAIAWITFGALWKWTIYLLLPVTLYEYYRVSRQMKSRGGVVRNIFILLVIASFGLLFPFIWNWQHDWVTLRHVEASVTSGEKGFLLKNPIEFLLSSTGLISWGYLCMGLYGIKIALFSKPLYIGTPYKKALQRLAIWIGCVWGYLFISSCYGRVQGNWAVIAAPPFFLFCSLGLHALLTGSGCSPRRKRLWIGIMLLFSLVPQVVVFGVHLLPFSKFVLKSPLKQGVGVDEIENILTQAGYSQKEALFLLSDKYQHVAQLERYAPGSPQTVYFMNLWNVRMNQYSLREFTVQEWLGKNGFFVAILPEREMDMVDMRIQKYITALTPYFKKVYYGGSYPLRTRLGIPVRQVLLFSCVEYNGSPLPNLTPSRY